MRHRKSGRRLSRTSPHRKAMWSNMVAALINHERIETTEAKAKELRRHAEKTITWATSLDELLTKEPEQRSEAEKARYVHHVRMARRVLKDRKALERLFAEVAPRFTDRPGGYTRIIRTRNRRGDNAPMAFVELVDFEPTAKAESAESAGE
jgi:large subunit ribosomal protein L17